MRVMEFLGVPEAVTHEHDGRLWPEEGRLAQIRVVPWDTSQASFVILGEAYFSGLSRCR